MHLWIEERSRSNPFGLMGNNRSCGKGKVTFSWLLCYFQRTFSTTFYGCVFYVLIKILLSAEVSCGESGNL